MKMTTRDKLQEYLTAQLDYMANKDFEVRMAVFQQCVGAVTFAMYNLAENSQEANEISAMWENEWREEFEKILYERGLTNCP